MANLIDGTSSNDNLYGTDDVDVFIGSAGNDRIDGGDAGYNQIDYSGAPSDYTFSDNGDGTVSVKKPGGGVDTISNISGFWFTGAEVWMPLADLLGSSGGGNGGGGNGGTINGTDGDDYLSGTSGDDHINAGGGVDVINGSAGNDVIDGGDAGYNQVDYDGAPSDYTFTQNADGTVTVNKPNGGTDTLSNIGGIWFKGSSEWKPLEDLLSNGGGNGGGGTINGTDGDDYLSGTSGDDEILAGLGRDVINGSAGNDHIDGGDTGYNQVDYDGAPSDYTFIQNNDGTVTVQKPNGGTDTLTNIGGFWFKGSQEWKPLEDVLSNGGGHDINTTDARDDWASTKAGEPVTIDALENDFDPEGDGQTITDFDQPDNGKVELINGKFVYTPDAGFTGTDVFCYTIKDDEGATDTAHVEISVEDSEPGSLSGRYFLDTNLNNIDDGEPGIAGVQVMLLNANGQPTGQTTFTDGQGNYSFGNLAAGTYGVKFTDPNGVLNDTWLVAPNVGDNDAIDSDALGDADESTISNITVNAGQDTPDNDAGVEDQPAPQPGSLSGRYFMDTNDNNQDDNGAEPAIAGIQVMLLDANGDPTGDITFTNGQGNYSFGNLTAGTYGVKFTDPNNVLDGKRLVDSNVGPDATDSDAIGNTTQSTISNITVTEGQNTPDNDAGAENIPVQPGSLSGRYFMDTNDNNQDDNGAEPAIAGVQVMLLDANGDPTGQITFTNNQGNYSFTDLAPGTYGVKFTDPNNVLDGKTLVDSNIGPDATDSDAIGNTTQSTISNITVTAGNNTPDNDAGAENVPGPVLGSIGDTVWFDSNRDGLQDDGEDGVEGVIVKLKDGDGNVLDATITDSDGKYLFDELEAGDYSVEFEDKDGFDFTERDAFGNFVDDRDSDADVNTGMTQTITLGEGEHRRDLDAGLIEEKVCIDFTTSVYGSTGNALIGTSNVIIQFKASDLPAGATLEHIDFGSVSNVWGNAQLPDYPGQNQHGEYVWTISTRTMGTSDGGIFGAELVAKIKLPNGELQEIHLCGDGEIEYFNIISPIALDLDNDGEIGVTSETTSKDKDADAEIGRTVEFDIDADGKLESIEWFDGSGDGILVDTSKIGSDGSIDGSALFGDEGGKYANGYEKLEAFDLDGDGMVSGAELEGLGLWIDDGDAVLEEGELQSAAEAGVSAVSTDMTIVLDEEGRELMRSEAVVNGEVIMTEDVWFAEADAEDIMAEANDNMMQDEEYCEDCVA